MLIPADVCLLYRIMLCLWTNLCFHQVFHWIPSIFLCLLLYVQSVWETMRENLPLNAYCFIIHIKWPEIIKCVVMWQIIDLGCKYWRARDRGRSGGGGRLRKDWEAVETPGAHMDSQAGVCKRHLPQQKHAKMPLEKTVWMLELPYP